MDPLLYPGFTKTSQGPSTQNLPKTRKDPLPGIYQKPSRTPWVSLGPWVVEKFVDSRYRYATDRITIRYSWCRPWHRLPDVIGSRHQSQHRVVRISTGTEFVPDGRKAAERSWWSADGYQYYWCLPMVTDVCQMVTNVYLMLAKESSVANPQKVAKIDEKSEK